MIEFLMILAFYAALYAWANAPQWHTVEGVALSVGLLIGAACIMGLILGDQ
jgi:hypothetical protein